MLKDKGFKVTRNKTDETNIASPDGASSETSEGGVLEGITDGMQGLVRA
jgi:hypothetical protein